MIEKERKKIFVVDDDEINNFVTSKLLTQYNEDYQIVTYSDPVEAYAVLDKTKAGEEGLPDIILLDINMPNMDGFEFLAKMKALGISDKIQVIMYTSSMQKDNKEKAKTFPNVVGYMEKPFSAQAYARMMELSYRY